jgi:hypothetical protein
MFYKKKTLIDHLWFVGEFVSNTFIDGFTDYKSPLKKFYMLHFVDIFIDEYNILPTKKLYMIPSMIFFHRRYFHW